MNDIVKNILLWAVIILVVVAVFDNIGPHDASAPKKMDYSTFVQSVDSNQIKNVDMSGRDIKGTTMDGTQFVTYLPSGDPFLTDKLIQHNVDVVATPPAQKSLLTTIFISWFPILLIAAVWLFFMRQMSGGKGGAFSFGKSKARLLGEDQIKVTLADVAGIEEAKEEVGEIVDFLKDPTKYSSLGGKIPKGILMVGPPGTGKTLLARAIAGEANVPFFSISGSDFVEMFVGVGASRVRDMFEQAKKRAPCIIFIDEIDAVGRHRGAGMGGGHDEREQTLNQLLVEMDGFADNEGVIVIAATNRPDVLDPALLRPGRFDRQVVVGLPDVKGREQIIKVHMRKVLIGDDVRPEFLARGTPGFSGAELANLVNEAALFAARLGKKKVSMEEFEKAKDKILMGAERRSMAMSEEEKKLTAYHEAGHAIIGRLVPDHDPVYKVSIIPRGRALGVTMYLPEIDRVSYSKRRLESSLSSLFGGRLAEELIFGKDFVTTGASNDIQRATDIARKMVTQWGLSEKLGPLTFGSDNDQPFLGHTMGTSAGKEFSESTSTIIDQEVRALIERNYLRAQTLLQDNLDILHAMAEALIKYETLDAKQVNDLMQRLEVGEPEGWTQSMSKNDSSSGSSSTVKPGIIIAPGPVKSDE
ncbi:MAG: ATP-dependent zinc metalloprotease FtsH [Gammaproteobacteria bacterium]|nr:ATP-dependent zinc metalloprotease FtsH [Gammaproteobacteria bacterium]